MVSGRQAVYVGITVALLFGPAMPALGSTAEQKDKAITAVERLVGSGTVRPTDLPNLPLVRDRILGGGQACTYIRGRLSAAAMSALRSSDGLGWEPEVDGVVAAGLNQMLADDDWLAFRSALARQLPAGLDEWLAKSPPEQRRVRLGRCILDVVLGDAVSPSGPVVYKAESPDPVWPGRTVIFVKVPGWASLEVDADSAYVKSAIPPPPPTRARRSRLLVSDAMGWARAWLQERLLLPPDTAVWRPLRLNIPEVAGAAADWELGWDQYAQGVQLPSDGSVYVSPNGFVTSYFRNDIAVTIPLTARVAVVEAFAIATRADPAAALRHAELRVWVRPESQLLIWTLDDLVNGRSVSLDANTGEVLTHAAPKPEAK